MDNVRRMEAADAASKSLGIAVLSFAQGRAECQVSVTAQMLNGHALCHGGYVFLLADTAFAYACNAGHPMTVASGADITFVASAREGDVLLAVALERTRYGRSGVYDVTVTNQDGAVVAEFRGRSRELRGS